jgi:hypothetical protein
MSTAVTLSPNKLLRSSCIFSLCVVPSRNMGGGVTPPSPTPFCATGPWSDIGRRRNRLYSSDISFMCQTSIGGSTVTLLVFPYHLRAWRRVKQLPASFLRDLLETISGKPPPLFQRNTTQRRQSKNLVV